MPFNFMIRIDGLPNGPAFFIPQGGAPGRPLVIRVGDTVHWGNATNFPHLPWPTDDIGNFLAAPFAPQLSEPIPSGSSSAALTAVGTGTFFYRCRVHYLHDESGVIIINP